MTARRLITRRVLLSDMGKAGLAAMVLGGAACSSEAADTATPTGNAASSTSAGSPGTSGSTSPPVTTSSSTDSSAAPEGPADSHRWHRVDLGFVSAYILYRDGEAVVVDTGVDGSDSSIATGLDELGLGWEDVGGLILTHKHPDHQGSAQAVLAATGSDTPWYAGAGDIEAITAPSAGQPVGDGDSVHDLEVIESPGHTPGHICVRDPVAGVLVAGDALNGAGGGGVAGPSPEFSEDMELANATVAKLAGFDYEVALFGHGEPVLTGASTQVSDLAASLG